MSMLEDLTPQARRVHNIMAKFGKITRMQAAHYGIANVTARISELRSAGVKVVCTHKRDADWRLYGEWKLGQ